MTRTRYEAQIRKVLEEHPEEIAIDFDGVPFTWAEVGTLVSAIERRLDEVGLAEDEKVGLMGRNLPTHFSALWAIFGSGRAPSMVHAFQPVRSLAEDIGENRWPVVLGEARDWKGEVITAADAVGTVGFAFTENREEPLRRVTRTATPGPLTDRARSDTALQLLSSGTTGKPKRISLSGTAVEEMIERTIYQFNLAGPAAQTDLILAWPISALGGTNAALPAIVLGQRLAIQEKLNAPRLLEMIRKYRPPFLSIPPAALAMILQLDPDPDDFASVKLFFSGASPLDPNVRRAFTEKYGVPVAEFYGATEFAGIITGWTADDLERLAEKAGSVGRALPGMRIRIVSPETGEILRPGQTGLVEAIVPRIGPDWTQTTDLAYLDEDGFLYLEGRADDAILRSGFKILPEEVANVLRTHPKVGDAAVIGIPDQRVGMVPAAAVERRADTSAPTGGELEEFLRARLPGYKIPARFAIVDEIPRTETMKPKRQGLRDLFK